MIRHNDVTNKIVSFFKSDIFKKYYIYPLVLLIAFFAFSIRDESLGSPYVNADDPHLGLRLGEYFAEHGSLPKNDSLRYYPIGFEYFGDRNMWPYTEGLFVWGAQKLGYPSVVGAQFFPPFFGFLGVIALFFAVRELFGNNWVALVSTIFFATLPASLYRANSAFADKEPIFTFLMFLFLLCFAKTTKKFDYKLSIGAGVLLFLANYTSGLTPLIQIILSIYAFVMLAINSKTREFTDSFLIISAIYSVFSLLLGIESLGSISILAAFGMMFLVGIYRLDQHFNFVKKYFPSNHNLHKYLGTYLIIGAFVLGILGAFVYTPLGDRVFGTLKIVTAPISASPFGQTVAENRPSGIQELQSQTGTDLSELGVSIFRDKFNARFGTDFEMTWLFTLYKINIFGAFYLSLVGLFVLVIQLFRKRINNELGIFLLVWYIVLFVMAKGAVRLLFMFVFPISILGAFGLVVPITYALRRASPEMRAYLKALFSIVVLFVISAHIFTGYGFGKQLGPSMSPNWEQALYWVGNNSNPDDTILSWWDYGYIIQHYADRRTYVDPANQYQHRNTEVAKFFTATNESEYVDWLKQNKVKYVIQDASMVGKYGAVTKLSHQEDLRYPGEPVDQFQIYGFIGASCVEPGENNTCNKGIFKYSAGPYELWLVQSRSEAYPVLVQNNQFVNITKLCVGGEVRVVSETGLDACATFSDREAILMGVRCGPFEKIGLQGEGASCIITDISNTVFSRMWFFDAEGLQYFRKVFDNGEVKVFEFLPDGKKA